jgi:hypothetical protein
MPPGVRFARYLVFGARATFLPRRDFRNGAQGRNAKMIFGMEDAAVMQKTQET